jgi:hypothetical protein
MIHSSEKRRDDEELANWERSKENFVPLKQGRNVHEIEANARMGKGDFLEKCERERRYFGPVFVIFKFDRCS